MPARVSKPIPEHHRHPESERTPPPPHINDPLHPANHWALRVAIGSILVPKRPSPQLPGGSRGSTSGTGSPYYSFPTSATHTPGTATPQLSGPGASAPFVGEYYNLHPHHPFHHPYGGVPHGPHTPSRLAQSSTPGAPQRDAQKAQASPIAIHSSENELAAPAEGLPRGPTPNGLARTQSARESPTVMATSRPGVAPLQPLNPVPPRGCATAPTTRSNSSPSDLPTIATCRSAADMVTVEVTTDGRPATPRAKFIQKLQSKSAWDALIHGSFS